MPDKFPYLARQINGPVAKSFGMGFDHVYEVDVPFIEFLSKFSLDNMSGKWLDMLGVVIGMPRPYYLIPNTMHAFMFDTTKWILDGDAHGFSTVKPVTINGKEYTRKNGGMLGSVFKSTTTVPMTDPDYKMYLEAVCEAKNARSLMDIANIVSKVTKSTMFVMDFSEQLYNDIRVTLAPPLMPYQEAVKTVLDKVFSTSPTVTIRYDAYFFERFVVEPAEEIVRNITGSDDFTITWLFDVTVMYMTVTLGNSIKGYRQEVFDALNERFVNSDDFVLNVV